MLRSTVRFSLLFCALALVWMTAGASALDFGAWVQDQLRDHSEQLFGFRRPLAKSSLGPYDGADNTNAIEVADGLKVSLVSSSVASAADQIAFWPDDEHPRYVFVCDEETSTPAVQRVDLTLPPGANATTIVTGLSACDPVRRTAWGTIIVAEEGGLTGGLYELINPASINAPIAVTNRTTGATSDPAHLVKRNAVGSLSFESFAIKPDGTMIYGDELAPSGGRPGGGIYKFIPQNPLAPGVRIGSLGQSPLFAGTIYGLHVGRGRTSADGVTPVTFSSNWGQGAETGKGRWTQVDVTLPNVMQNGEINLDAAQAVQLFTGFYRPEDMDIDPIAAEDGIFRVCWANTGRWSHAFGSAIETGAVNAEIMCLVEEADAPSPTGFRPVVTRFIAGNRQGQMFDNVAFQPHTGNLVVLEDGPVNVANPDGTTRLTRGDDMWICLPDGSDDDDQSDGCVRFASIRDTTAEPTGFIFLGSGEAAFVNIQHRKVNDNKSPGGAGALIKISGFDITPNSRGHHRNNDNDDDNDRGNGHNH